MKKSGRLQGCLQYSFKKWHLKMSSAKWRLFSLGSVCSTSAPSISRWIATNFWWPLSVIAWGHQTDNPWKSGIVLFSIEHYCLTAMFLRDTRPIRLIFSQHCWYWWFGALAPGLQLIATDLSYGLKWNRNPQVSILSVDALLTRRQGINNN